MPGATSSRAAAARLWPDDNPWWQAWADHMDPEQLLRLVLPLGTRLTGYGTTALLGLGENLPAGVALQWSRWCARGGYATDPAYADKLTRVINTTLRLQRSLV